MFYVLYSLIGFLSSLYIAGVVTVKYFIIDDAYLTCNRHVSTRRYSDIFKDFVCAHAQFITYTIVIVKHLGGWLLSIFLSCVLHTS